jgi:hypothetical protein
MPFSIASFDDGTSARVGVAECINHDLLHIYPILAEKSGEFVAQFKATAVLLPSGTLVLNDYPFDKELYETPIKIEDKEVLDLLNAPLGRKKDQKGKDKPKTGKQEQKTEIPVPKVEAKAEEKKDVAKEAKVETKP